MLCDFMDILCTHVVAADSFYRYGDLHDTTLPRTWVRFVKNWDGELLASQMIPSVLVKSMVAVFELVMSMKSS